jgi:hypothetical protein
VGKSLDIRCIHWGQAARTEHAVFLSRIHSLSVHRLFRPYAFLKYLIRFRFTRLSTAKAGVNYYYYPELTPLIKKPKAFPIAPTSRPRKHRPLSVHHVPEQLSTMSRNTRCGQACAYLAQPLGISLEISCMPFVIPNPFLCHTRIIQGLFRRQAADSTAVYGLIHRKGSRLPLLLYVYINLLM